MLSVSQAVFAQDVECLGLREEKEIVIHIPALVITDSGANQGSNKLRIVFHNYCSKMGERVRKWQACWGIQTSWNGQAMSALACAAMRHSGCKMCLCPLDSSIVPSFVISPYQLIGDVVLKQNAPKFSAGVMRCRRSRCVKIVIRLFQTQAGIHLQNLCLDLDLWLAAIAPEVSFHVWSPATLIERRVC